MIFTGAANLDRNRKYMTDYSGLVIGVETSLKAVIEKFSNHVKKDSNNSSKPKEMAESGDSDDSDSDDLAKEHKNPEEVKEDYLNMVRDGLA